MYKVIFLSIFCIGFQPTEIEKLRYANYKAAINNESTFQFFTVVKINNRNSGETREVCTKGDFFKREQSTENLILDYGNKSCKKVNRILIKNRKRHFEFKNKEALQNIGFNSYSIEEYNKFKEKLIEENFLEGLKRKTELVYQTQEATKRLKMIAHFLFNEGILTGENNCFGGALEESQSK